MPFAGHGRMVDADTETVASAAINVVTKKVDSKERLVFHRMGRIFRQKDIVLKIKRALAAAVVDDIGHGQNHVTNTVCFTTACAWLIGRAL